MVGLTPGLYIGRLDGQRLLVTVLHPSVAAPAPWVCTVTGRPVAEAILEGPALIADAIRLIPAVPVTTLIMPTGRGPLARRFG